MDLATRERWKNRVGGTLGIVGILMIPAAEWWMRSDGASPFLLLLLFPAGFVTWMALEALLGPAFRVLAARVTAWSIRPGARRSFEVARLGGVPLFVHWTFVLVPLSLLPGALLWPMGDAALVSALVLVVLIHEAGHAVAARLRGCRVDWIELRAMHGATSYSLPPTEWDGIVIAWSGVLAQLAVAAPAWVLLRRLSPASPAAFLLLLALGPYNLAIAGLNLLPIAGLDGATAWRVLRRRKRWRPKLVRFPRE